jgi:pSer/pThr/pTyr-binding forkhead associated (FHA) protein
MAERKDGVRISWQSGPQTKGGGSATFPIGSVITIGRSADNAIVLEDDRVSRAHARLEIKGGEVVFTDLNSTNGSVIDGRSRIGTSIWREGQKLQVGHHVLELQFVRGAPITVVRPLVEAPLASTSGPQEDVPTRMDTRTRSAPAAGQSTNAQPAPAAAPTQGLRRLEIVLNCGSITDVSAPAYAVGVFEHINPTGTRGAALALDEKLGGVLGTMAQGRAFDSRVGEISVVPMPQHERSLTALLIFAGMGAINAFAPAVLEIVGEKLAKALSNAKVLEFATVPMGVGTGLSIKDFVVRFLTGFLRGLTGTKDGEAVQKVSISEVDKDRSEAIRREIKALIDDGYFARLGYQVVVSEAQNRVRGGEPTLPTAPPTTPVYLQVLHTSETNLEYCLLSAELGAAIQLFEQAVDPGEQSRLAETIAKLREFDAKIGGSLANTYVPASMQDLICRSLQKTTAHLVIIHDQASSTIPWEAFYFKERCPALELGVSRLYRIANRAHVAGPPMLAAEATLRMLVVENPTGDLAGAQNEGEQLTELFKSNRGHVMTLRGADASRANVLSELGSGNYDLLHYAGHADFVELKPEASGLILKDGRLTAADLLELKKLPHMIFLNACESGRMRGGGASDDKSSTHFVGQVSLAESFLLNGIANFIGTYWPVNDDAALKFANTFYGGLLSGKSLSAAMREARQATKSVSQRDWANYLHFGDPLYRVRQA